MRRGLTCTVAASVQTRSRPLKASGAVVPAVQGQGARRPRGPRGGDERRRGRRQRQRGAEGAPGHAPAGASARRATTVSASRASLERRQLGRGERGHVRELHVAGAARHERGHRPRDLVRGAVDDRVAHDLGGHGLRQGQRLGAAVGGGHEGRQAEGAVAERVGRAAGGEGLRRPGERDEAHEQRPVDGGLGGLARLGDDDARVEPRGHGPLGAPRRPRRGQHLVEHAGVVVGVGRERQPAVGLAPGQAQPARAVGGDPDRRRPVAQRAQAQDRAAQAEVLAVVVDRVRAAHQQSHDLEPLLQARQRAVVGDPEGLQVQGLARPHAQQEAPAGEVVERQRRLGQRGRVVADDVRDADPQADLAGGAGRRGDDRDRVEPDVGAGLAGGGLGHEVRRPDGRREPVEQVVRVPDGVEALLLAALGGRQHRVRRRAHRAHRRQLETGLRHGGQPTPRPVGLQCPRVAGLPAGGRRP